MIRSINCIQILGWDHDICNLCKERSLIHQTSRFYRIWACLWERHLGRECVSMCERPPMGSETTRKRLMYTLIKDINCIQILGWDHDICNSRKERSLIHQTSRFYRIWACLCYYSTQLIHIVSILNSRQCIALAIEYKREYSSCCVCKAHYTYESYTMNIINSYLWTSIHLNST